MTKSELYLAFLPLVNSRAVALIEHPRLEHQLINLERKVTRGGRDTIDHARGSHDDIANAVAGACVLAQEQGDVPVDRLQSRAIDADAYDPLASVVENRESLLRAEARAGYFTGPGLAPTWHISGMDLQTHAINEG
jgi:hypothetical protein